MCRQITYCYKLLRDPWKCKYIYQHYCPRLIKKAPTSPKKCITSDVPPKRTTEVIKTPNIPIIMMNGDLLTKVDFKHLLDFHDSNNADATMCVREYDFQVPYGVVTIDGFSIKEIKEKPVYNFFVNAGIYVLNKNLIHKVDGESYLDITDFLEKELGSGNVNAFPIHEYWLDIGRMEEYEKANQDVSSIFKK